MKWHSYPDHRPSEVACLDSYPEGWQRLPLKRWVKIKITDGPHETPELRDEGIDFVSAEAIQDGRINFEARRGFISEDLHKLYSRKCRPRKNDIFLCKSGATTGKVALVEIDREFSVWSPLAQIRADETKILPEFLFLSLQAEYVRNQVRTTWSAGTQPNIAMGAIETLVVVAPSPAEQRAIAGFLDRETTRIDALIAKKQRQIELLQEKRAALISHAVTRGLDPNVPLKDSGVQWLQEIPAHWEVRQLKWIAALRAGAAITAESIDEIGGYPVFGGNGIRGFTTSYTHEGEFPLIGRQGALCGCVNFASGRFWASEHAIVAAPRPEVDPRWLMYLLCAMSLNSYSESAAQPGLAVETISAVPVPTQAGHEQSAIAAFLDCHTRRADALIEKIQKSIDLLREYRTALVSAAVTGKIDVREAAA